MKVSLAIKEMEIETKIRYYCLTIKWTKIIFISIDVGNWALIFVVEI